MSGGENKRAGFIGAGKVATSLGAYFLTRNIPLAGYLSKNFQSAQDAARLTNSQAFSDTEPFLKNCDIVFITTPDDQIKYVWQEISRYDIRNKTICHTSGALSSLVFNGIEDLGAFGYALHPMCAFPDRSGNIQGLDSIYFTVESGQTRRKDMPDFIGRLKNPVIVIEAEDKPLYHAASVMVSNFVLALISLGVSTLHTCGINKEEALLALLPLIKGNIGNIEANGILRSLTGPVERNDIKTIEKHLAALPAEGAGIYKELTAELLNLAQEKHPARDYTELLRIIEDRE